ncbi:uncharacterized protein [Lolium perenne]|uniref:uncharacterized protein isoform X2 n=1 Tax=Lolium perenne TaxID=4522 RepID=UPI0021F5E124|nr:uncharacterized protein LOC127318589 isoform X2 [Lolium perenne]
MRSRWVPGLGPSAAAAGVVAHGRHHTQRRRPPPHLRRLRRARRPRCGLARRVLRGQRGRHHPHARAWRTQRHGRRRRRPTPQDCCSSELDMHGSVCIRNAIQDRMGLLHYGASTHLRDQIVGRCGRNGICTFLYVKQHGIAIFLMPSGLLGTLLSLVDVIPLFSNTVWGQNANLAFLQKRMGASFEKRSQPWSANIRKEDVHSGDFLALSKIRGRWGGFQTLEKWVTGAFAGHTAVCLKDENGTLWIAESGYENKKGEEIIAVVPWDEWWGMALKDDSNPQVALLPLHPDVRAKFNESAAWEFARGMYGKPYGYHNMIFSWIDTMSENYPPPLDANLVMAAMSMWSRLQPRYASNMWNEALNKRLGTEQLDLHGIITETEKRGMSFNQLLTIPEQDEWEYSDGKSTTCVAFILSMYKAAGVFAPFTESIQVTEFTIRDAYMLRMFEDNRTRLPGWCNGDADGLPFCQILGEYKMELPEYNTIEPYANMNENCPSSPPTYNRPMRC